MEHTARPALTPATPRTGLRPYLTAGVAVLGAGMIAATPVVSSDIAADIQHRAVDLVVSDYAVNPIQTWIDVFQMAGYNIEALAANWLSLPASATQQVLANWVQYASEYVGNYQAAAAGGVNYFLGTAAHRSFSWFLHDAMTQFMNGDISLGVSRLFEAFYSEPMTHVLFPLENQLLIPGQFLQNLTNAYDFLSTTGLQILAEYALLSPQSLAETAIGQSLQGAYDAWQASSPIGVLTNLLDMPGLIANGVLNGNSNGLGGLLGAPSELTPYGAGLFNAVASTIPRLLASNIVVSGAQNIMQGGSVITAIQDFINQLFTGWPSLQEIITDLQNLWDMYGPGGSAAAAALSGVADVTPMLPAASTLSADLVSAADLGGLSSLSVLPADVASMLGGLGGDLASVFNPAALLGMLPF